MGCGTWSIPRALALRHTGTNERIRSGHHGRVHHEAPTSNTYRGYHIAIGRDPRRLALIYMNPHDAHSKSARLRFARHSNTSSCAKSEPTQASYSPSLPRHCTARAYTIRHSPAARPTPPSQHRRRQKGREENTHLIIYWYNLRLQKRWYSSL